MFVTTMIYCKRQSPISNDCLKSVSFSNSGILKPTKAVFSEVTRCTRNRLMLSVIRYSECRIACVIMSGKAYDSSIIIYT